MKMTKDYMKDLVLLEAPKWMEGTGDYGLTQVFEHSMHWLNIMIEDTFDTFKLPKLGRQDTDTVVDTWGVVDGEKRNKWKDFVSDVIYVREYLGVSSTKEEDDIGIYHMLKLYADITSLFAKEREGINDVWKNIEDHQPKMITNDEEIRKKYHDEAIAQRKMDKINKRGERDRKKRIEEGKKKEAAKKAAAEEENKKEMLRKKHREDLKKQQEKKAQEEERKKNDEMEDKWKKEEEKKKKAKEEEKGGEAASQLYLQSLIKQSEFMGRNRYFVHGKLSPMVYSQANENVWCKCLVALFDGTKEYAIAQWRDLQGKINQCNDPELVAKLESCINNDNHSASVMRAIARKYGLSSL
jgi:hypothetical protein